MRLDKKRTRGLLQGRVTSADHRDDSSFVRIPSICCAAAWLGYGFSVGAFGRGGTEGLDTTSSAE